MTSDSRINHARVNDVHHSRGFMRKHLFALVVMPDDDYT